MKANVTTADSFSGCDLSVLMNIAQVVNRTSSIRLYASASLPTNHYGLGRHQSLHAVAEATGNLSERHIGRQPSGRCCGRQSQTQERVPDQGESTLP